MTACLTRVKTAAIVRMVSIAIRALVQRASLAVTVREVSNLLESLKFILWHFLRISHSSARNLLGKLHEFISYDLMTDIHVMMAFFEFVYFF